LKVKLQCGYNSRTRIALSSASRSPLFPLSIGLHSWVQALRTNPDIATLHSNLRLGIHSAVNEMHQRTSPSSAAVPHPHDLAARVNRVLVGFKELDRQLEKKMHSKLPSPRNLPLVVWMRGNLSARHYNTRRAPPAIMSAQHSPSQNGTPNAVSSAFSKFCERLLLMMHLETTARDKRFLRHTPVHQSVEMLQYMQGFPRSPVALQPDMEDATTDRRAYCRGGRENELLSGMKNMELYL